MNEEKINNQQFNYISSCYPNVMLDDNKTKMQNQNINTNSNYDGCNNSGCNFNPNANMNPSPNGNGFQNFDGGANQNINFANMFQNNNGGNIMSNLMSMISQKMGGGENNLMSLMGNIMPNMGQNGANILGSLFKNDKKETATKDSPKIESFKKIKNLD